MKKLYSFCFALFAFAASASNGLGNPMGKDFFPALDTLAVQQSQPIEKSESQASLYIAPQASISIKKGTATNITAIKLNTDKVASISKNEATLYIAPATIFFIAENTSTNMVVLQSKTVKKPFSQAIGHKKSNKADVEKGKVFQFTEAKNQKEIFEKVLASADIPAPVLKDNKTKNPIVARLSNTAVNIYRKRKGYSSKHSSCQNSNAFAGIVAYALLSRPPTAA
ncbi:hypothetical protein [uncultured Flavobacterium sp.]|uniref:hypothetical protein n=1 Tax=uncultured Flavobacterium sp. TaxID=165435 RepID=UPI0025E4A039|nr:hypothetical protein [uncultured Flavobacterium sp.]